MRVIAFAAVIGLCASACIVDPHRNKRPARLQLGTSARGFPVTSTADQIAVGGQVSKRTETTSSMAQLGAVTGSAQFTMSTPHHLYLGGEIEAGVLERAGSNIAGAYGVAGLEHSLGFGSVGVEVAGGWRAIRLDLDQGDVNTAIIEPRLRADVWISPQLTLGAATGVTVGGHTGWMGGVFLGVHSTDFGAWPHTSE
jgi:hypothetical protein